MSTLKIFTTKINTVANNKTFLILFISIKIHLLTKTIEINAIYQLQLKFISCDLIKKEVFLKKTSLK
ncbi:MAG: hypothetical protein KKC03_02755 [Bacteroidetes bacterium]|nr:hypothetical protein [Bacteroidota bacterium]